MTNDVIVLEPRRGLARFDLRSLWAYRELVYFLVWRDLKIRYKQTVIGAAWAVIQPLALMAVFTIFFGKFAQLPTDGIPRALFYFCGLVPWTYFSHSVVNSTNSVVANRAVITKVYFPRLVLPISSVTSLLADVVIGVVLLLGMSVVMGHTPDWHIVFLPAFIAMAFLTAFVVGVWLSALNARYRDVGYAVNLLVYVWMFASPIAYPTSIVPERWQTLYGLNPMVTVIDGFRWSVVGGDLPSMNTALASLGLLFVGLIGGMLYFRSHESRIADVI